MLNRILFGIILITSAFVFQWWISIVLAFVGLFYFNNLYEAIFVGIVIDSLYGISPDIFFFDDFNFMFTILMIIGFLAIGNLKTKLLI
jgi:hypothetical protein